MRAAFTLLELMVVIVLIGILTALIVPEMKGTFDDALLRATARQLASACRLAYSQAVSVNQPHRVRLDSKKGAYILERKSQKGDTRHGFIPVQNMPEAQGELDQRISVELHRAGEDASDKTVDESPKPPEDEAFAPKEQAITFYPDGTADPGEWILKDPEGFRLALRINPTTARARIVELERK